MFAIYAPIYVYTFCVLYVILLIGSSLPAKATPSLNIFHQSNKVVLNRLLFILTLAALLGTPPTIGFFAKLLTFYILIQAAAIYLILATAFTLVLLIFYLQAIRTRNTLRKKGLSNILADGKKNTFVLIYGQYALCLFTLCVPYVFDIMYSYYI